ncbi:uncharacterized protein TNCV_4888961 [Trichonephila clavipes]|nr:uncharacterized protein TNCV_4888961 [Trichonephila clavipes]
MKVTLVSTATPAHCPARLQWCLARSGLNHADWGRIVFSEESRFQLCFEDDRRRVWRRPGQHAELAITIALNQCFSKCGVRPWGRDNPTRGAQHIETSADWAAKLVCRWPSAPQVAGSTPAHVGEFSRWRKSTAVMNGHVVSLFGMEKIP